MDWREHRVRENDLPLEPRFRRLDFKNSRASFEGGRLNRNSFPRVESMWRLVALVVIPCGIGAALLGTWAGTWALFEGRFRGAASLFAFVAFWLWGAYSAYHHEFKLW